MYNEKDVNGDTNLFNKNTRALLYRLKEKATSKENNNGKQDLPEIGGKRLGMKMLYATGEKSLRTMKLYGMVQCTKDLSIKDCIVCLNWIIAKLPTCCSNKQGGRVLSTSCNFRYELYRFVKTWDCLMKPPYVYFVFYLRVLREYKFYTLCDLFSNTF